MRRYFLCITAMFTAASAFAAIPDSLTVKTDAIYPEGIAYFSKTGDFFISSLSKGTIGRVNQKGEYFPFSHLEDGELISTVGMWVDTPRKRLLACVSDPGVGRFSAETTKEQYARLVIFDIPTKKKTHALELSKLVKGKHFCNDLTVDKAGNIYITDSFSPVIYVVNTQHKVKVFARSPSFSGEGFNLNGIVYHPDGYLLVAKYNDGTLWKIEIKTKAISQVILPEPYPANTEVAGIQNGKDNKIRKFKTTDGWKTAKAEKTVDTGLRFPTTGVKVDGKVYVIEGKLDELFADPKKANSKEFTIKGFAL